MNLQSAIDAVLVLVLLLDLALLAAGRLATCIHLFAFQSLLVALLAPAAELIHGTTPGLDAWAVAAATLGLKVALIPRILIRIIRTGEIHREVEPLIGFTASIVAGALLIAGSFGISGRLPLPTPPMSPLLVPVALSTLLTGLLIMVSRVKAVTQVVGYLVLENGIYLFGLMLLRRTPLLVELGILLDVFVGVFIMAIVVCRIREEFDHMDTHRLDEAEEA